MADPFTELGLSRRPLFQMFGLPEDRGAASPLMQQAVQEDRIQQAAQMKLEQDFADLERRGQAEAAADEFVRQNPDAAMAGSSRFGDILRYQQTQQRGPSYSAQVLRRSLASKLPPAARERFYTYLDEGRDVNQAFDDAEADEEDMKTRIELVEAGLPREALARFEGQRIDPLTAAELRASLKGGGKDPAIAALESNFDVLRKEYEDARSLGEVPPELEQEYRDTRNELLNRRRALYSPQQRTPDAAKPLVDAVAAGSMGAPAAPAPAAVAPPPVPATPEEQAIPANVPFAEIPAYLRQIEEQKAKAGEKQAVSEQWTQQKSALQQRLAQAFPDTPIPGTKTTQLEALARAVLAGDMVPDDTGAVDSETGAPITIPASFYALQKLGIAPDVEAFRETGNQRTGSQKVSAHEVVKAWAEDFVKQRALTDKEPSAGALPPEVREKARAKVLEQIDNG